MRRSRTLGAITRVDATRNGVQPSENGYSWATALAADRSVAIVADTGDELIYLLRRAGAQRFAVIPPHQLALDAAPGTIEATFEVVFIGAPADDNGSSLLEAQALLADGGHLVVVPSLHPAPFAKNETGVATSESEAQIEQLERRRAALLRELLECEAALVESEDIRDALLDEIRAMSMTLSWRVTRPLRWVRALTRKR